MGSGPRWRRGSGPRPSEAGRDSCSVLCHVVGSEVGRIFVLFMFCSQDGYSVPLENLLEYDDDIMVSYELH